MGWVGVCIPPCQAAVSSGSPPCTAPPCPVFDVCCCSGSEEHRLAYEQFCEVAVWRKGMPVRVPISKLLAAIG